MSTLLQQVANGVAIGSVYALIAIGFTLVYGVIGLINFAHGDILMFGTFVAFWAKTDFHVPLLVAAVIGILAAAAAACIVELVASRPVRHANAVVPMITTAALGLVLRNVVELRSSSRVLPFETPLSGKAVEILGARVSVVTFVTIAVAIAVIFVFGAFLERTKSGLAVRAVGQDLSTSRLMGIPINQTVLLVFAMSGALSVVGGLLYASAYGVVFVGMGFQLLIKGFVAAIAGGVGSLVGAAVGGLVLGLAEALAAPYVSGVYRDGIACALLIGTLLVRPTGFFGKPEVVKV